MNRETMLDRLRSDSEPWDIAIVGGGATGLGAAVDAASRGYRTVLLEQHDFAKATSSRSTKLMHGGVRYLAQGNISLVLGALRERGLVLRNAPHLVHDLAFVIPAYRWWEGPYYGVGLRLYNVLAGRYGIAPSRNLDHDSVAERLPNVRKEGLRGGILYFDGQFDDARLAITLAQTAADHGAAVLNYCRVEALRKEQGRVCGVTARDVESGDTFEIGARVVVNAAGVFTDVIRHMDDAAAKDMILPSQGVHVVLDRKFLPGECAMMIPKTEDGRVLFAIPWHNHVVVGTTDTEVDEPSLEPRPLPEELDFLMHHMQLYLASPPAPNDVRAVFAGLRPLVKPDGGGKTSSISRDHVVRVSPSQLVTVTGGKWTTYRHMAEDAVNRAIQVGGLPERPCATKHLPLHGATRDPLGGSLQVYGTEGPGIRKLENDDTALAESFSETVPITPAQVVWAVRHEMARTVEDVLARRTRCLFLDAREAIAMAPRVAAVMAREMGRDATWEASQADAFHEVARGYLMPGTDIEHAAFST